VGRRRCTAAGSDLIAATDVAGRLASTRLGPAPLAALGGEGITARLRDRVLAVLSGDATLSPRDVIYAFAPSADRVSPRLEDFVARAADDGARSLWLTVGGDLRRPDATDLPRPPLAWATLAASRDSGVHPLDAGGDLWAVRDHSLAVVGTGVGALVEGSDDRALWTLSNGQVAALPAAPAPDAVGCVALAAGIGDCSAICLERDGTAWGLRTRRPKRRLARGVTELQQGLGAEQGRAAYLLCGNGDLLRAARGRLGRLAIRRVWDAADYGARARTIRLGLAGGWVALLLDDGTVANGRIEFGAGSGAGGRAGETGRSPHSTSPIAAGRWRPDGRTEACAKRRPRRASEFTAQGLVRDDAAATPVRRSRRVSLCSDSSRARPAVRLPRSEISGTPVCTDSRRARPRG
jgi:hypothetical protein